MLCGLFFYYTKFTRIISKKFIEYAYSTFFFSRISEDVKALEKIEKLWRDALTAAVNNHAEMAGVKENTDTESSGEKMSIGEKLETKAVVGAIKDNIDKISKKRCLMLNMM